MAFALSRSSHSAELCKHGGVIWLEKPAVFLCVIDGFSVAPICSCHSCCSKCLWNCLRQNTTMWCLPVRRRYRCSHQPVPLALGGQRCIHSDSLLRIPQADRAGFVCCVLVTNRTLLTALQKMAFRAAWKDRPPFSEVRPLLAEAYTVCKHHRSLTAWN